MLHGEPIDNRVRSNAAVIEERPIAFKDRSVRSTYTISDEIVKPAHTTHSITNTPSSSSLKTEGRIDTNEQTVESNHATFRIQTSPKELYHTTRDDIELSKGRDDFNVEIKDSSSTTPRGCDNDSFSVRKNSDIRGTDSVSHLIVNKMSHMTSGSHTPVTPVGHNGSNTPPRRDIMNNETEAEIKRSIERIIDEGITAESSMGIEPTEDWNKDSRNVNVVARGKTFTSAADEVDTASLKPVRPRARPVPLRRGTTRIPPKRRVETAKPTGASASKLLEKTVNLSELKWNEIIKCHTEICNITDKHPELFSECDPDSLIMAVRAIVSHANSGRSNLSNSGIVCLGHLYKSLGTTLGQLLPGVLDICVRKAASGSPEFICASANLTLSKICLSSSAAKVSAILLKLYKTNKSAHLTILNCMIILLDSIGPNTTQLKHLEDIVDMCLSSLKAGSITLRNAAKILIALINDQKDIIKLLGKMRRGPDAVRLVTTALRKYNYEEKLKYLQRLTSEAI
uniref:TOG domain-containing protein n=2 Tax=Babesia bovis TaxID=5865 RepID=A7AW05_BABBO|eukprot:XP_001608801.1 hypothetical protein [Babesia bovis T2Bo]